MSGTGRKRAEVRYANLGRDGGMASDGQDRPEGGTGSLACGKQCRYADAPSPLSENPGARCRACYLSERTETLRGLVLQQGEVRDCAVCVAWGWIGRG